MDITFICNKCKGKNVFHDAWAEWDEEKQEWVLRAYFDYTHCEDCDGETTLEEVELCLT